MVLYYPDMVSAIDLVKEDARLPKVEFKRKRPRVPVKAVQPRRSLRRR